MDMQIGMIARAIAGSYAETAFGERGRAYPDKHAVVDAANRLVALIFPGYFGGEPREARLEVAVLELYELLAAQAAAALGGDEQRADAVTRDFLRSIPAIRELVADDLQAAFDGDPAATDMYLIITSYPGVFAVTVYRLAHRLYQLGVPYIPRVMSEYAHSVTGIDIHPGADIGRHFFIDHGTGVVIGETTKIGDRVTIYQGVTLGARSTKGGQGLRGVKRHPTIGDDVTIYSGASVLGGETEIGDGVTIGGNAFVTNSVPSDTVVVAKREDVHKRAMPPDYWYAMGI